MTAADLHQMEAFAGPRAGWRVVAVPEEWAFYARRFVVVMDVTFTLVLRHNPDRPLSRDCWKSGYSSADGRFDETWSGTLDHVTELVDQVEKRLDVINALRECRTVAAAAELVSPLKGEDVRFIAHVLGLGWTSSVATLRDRIVRRACGARPQNNVLTDYRKW